jgi:hypothetical protein
VVAASDATPAGIARAAKGLGAKKTDALVFQTGDCGEKRNVFGVALEIVDSADEAKTALLGASALAKGAYIKRCAVASGSLLALRFHAVDPSIAGVPTDAVNWTDADRISKATRLSDGRTLVAQRIFVDDPEDPLEGMRVRMVLVGERVGRKVLVEDCLEPERFTVSGDVLAFQCVGSMAGDYSLHEILVFDGTGHQVAKVEECRNPKLPDGSTLVCSAEAIGDRGLKLRTKRVKLSESKAAQPPAAQPQSPH